MRARWRSDGVSSYFSDSREAPKCLTVVVFLLKPGEYELGNSLSDGKGGRIGRSAARGLVCVRFNISAKAQLFGARGGSSRCYASQR